jgi:hypothetical protein
MLGRHEYRVRPENGRWTVSKEGEDRARGEFPDRQTATAQACRLAESDEPSRVTIDDGEGRILEERLFGADLSQELGA